MAYKRFLAPREVIYGWGALDSLKGIEGKKALLVTDRKVRGLGIAAKVEGILASKNIETAVFDEVEPDPSKQTVKKGTSLAQSFQPDLVLGLGGGSALDAGKAIWAFYEHPDLLDLEWQEAVRAVRRRRLRAKARYIGIPTTSGTGSEVSGAAVITDREVKPAVKTILISAQLIPDLAIADPELASTMPPGVTADTGFDALVHCLECYVLSPPSDLVDPLALRALTCIYRWLPRAVENGGDREARERMHTAATVAGLAMSNNGLGLIHDTAHQLGSAFGIPHGRANALMLSHGLAYLYPTVKERLAEVASALGIRASTEREAARRLLEAIEGFKASIGLPASIKEAGVEQEKFLAYVDQMSANAVALRLRPPELPVAEVKGLYLAAWSGPLKLDALL